MPQNNQITKQTPMNSMPFIQAQASVRAIRSGRPRSSLSLGTVYALTKTEEISFRSVTKRRCPMFVNCFDSNDICLFAVRVKDGTDADSLGDYICRTHELINYWLVRDSPVGAVVRY